MSLSQTLRTLRKEVVLMFKKITWDERVGLWSDRGWIAVAVLAGIWVLTSLLTTVWKAAFLTFFKNLSGWLIMPVLVVTIILWLASIVLRGGNRGENWTRRLFKIGVKCAGITIGIFLAKLLFTKCAQFATSGGFFQGLFATIASFLANLIVPAIVVTLVVFIVSYLAKSRIGSEWIDRHFGDRPEPADDTTTTDDSEIWGGDLWS